MVRKPSSPSPCNTLGGRNLGNEARILNSDETSHERSQGQVGPLRNTTLGAKH